MKQAIANGWYGPPMDLTLLSIFKSRFVESIFNVINDEENGRSSARRWEASKYKPRRCLISSPGNGYLTEKFRGSDPDPDVGSTMNLVNKKYLQFTIKFTIFDLISDLYT